MEPRELFKGLLLQVKDIEEEDEDAETKEDIQEKVKIFVPFWNKEAQEKSSIKNHP